MSTFIGEKMNMQKNYSYILAMNHLKIKIKKMSIHNSTKKNKSLGNKINKRNAGIVH